MSHLRAHYPVTLYQGLVKRHLEPGLGNVRLSRLTDTVIEWGLHGIGRKVKGNGRTVQLCFSTLRSALNYAVKKGYLAVTPCQGLKPPRATQREMHVLSPEEVDKFLLATRSNPLFALFETALTTGMRRGELLGLRWGDVSLSHARGFLQVRRQLVEVDGIMCEGEVKTRAARRRIVLFPESVKTLQALKGNSENESFVFSRDGQPYTGTVVTRLFKAALKTAKVPEISFHETRHTHATCLLIEGVSPKVVQERLGHSNVTITLQTYSHVLPTMQEDALAALGNLLTYHKQPGRRVLAFRRSKIAS